MDQYEYCFVSPFLDDLQICYRSPGGTRRELNRTTDKDAFNKWKCSVPEGYLIALEEAAFLLDSFLPRLLEGGWQLLEEDIYVRRCAPQ